MLELPAPILSLPEQAARVRDGGGARYLTDRVITVRGDDRVEWLAGMVTNDTKSLAAGHSGYAAVVQVKGKIIADVWVHVRADVVLLVVPADTVDPLLEHFNNHIIMEDVETSAVDDARVLHVSGRKSREILPVDGRAIFATDRIGWEGVDVLWGVGADPEAVSARLRDGGLDPVSEPAWEIARLEAGYPRFGVDFGTDNYVQEANITSRAVSFRKGCYTGQEVVCRLEMRGHVRRQLVALRVNGDAPAPGAVVGADVGTVTSSANSAALGAGVALAMVKWDVASAGGSIEVAGQSATIVPRPLA